MNTWGGSFLSCLLPADLEKVKYESVLAVDHTIRLHSPAVSCDVSYQHNNHVIRQSVLPRKFHQLLLLKAKGSHRDGVWLPHWGNHMIDAPVRSNSLFANYRQTSGRYGKASLHSGGKSRIGFLFDDDIEINQYQLPCVLHVLSRVAWLGGGITPVSDCKNPSNRRRVSATSTFLAP